MKNNNRKRRRMWEKNPKCFWCGRVTVWYDKDPHKVGKTPKNMATLDHLRPRHDPTRREVCVPGEVRIVLACWECNNLRDKPEREARGAHLTTKPLAEYTDAELFDAYARAKNHLLSATTAKRQAPLVRSLKDHLIPELQKRGLEDAAYFDWFFWTYSAPVLRERVQSMLKRKEARQCY